MPQLRAFRSSASRPGVSFSHVALASVLVLAGLAACKSKESTDDTADKTSQADKSDKAAKGDTAEAGAQAKAAPSAAPDPSASAEATAKTDPAEDQQNPNGSFKAPKAAPPPDPPPVAIKPVVFDTDPPEVKLPPVKEEEGHCGELDLGGGDKVYLDCMTDDYGTVPGAAKSFASVEDYAGSKKPRHLPATVDHRKDGTEGAILSQGRSPACTAFSLTAVADHAAAHFLGHPGDLSPMHAWARYHTPKMSLADNDNIGRGLTDLTTFPFDAKLAVAWQRGSRVDPGVLHHADARSLVEITNISKLETNNMTEIKSALAAGQDVWFSIKGAHGLQHPKKNADGESMVSHFDSRKNGGQQSGHAIVLAGYEETPKGTFYLIHNSWGTKWGTDGYAWIWEKTLHANLTSAYVISVKPTELAHSKHREHSHKLAMCSANLAPDAVTAQCVPPCEDSGPRVNGVCPTAGQCPEGQVNLDGKCELSAPVLEKTLSNGVKMTCGMSGCTYIVPNGTASCTSEKGCNVSCAAPRFMLGSGTRGLACTG
jgi:hypothetical protein